MLNNVILVGKVFEKGENFFKIAVNRSFKNEEGIYETDVFKINIWGNINKNFNEYCNVGDIIGVKGRLSTNLQTNEIFIEAERITFLSSTKNSVEDLKEREEK